MSVDEKNFSFSCDKEEKSSSSHFLSQLKDILPSIILAFLMGGLVYLVNYLGLSVIITLIIMILW